MEVSKLLCVGDTESAKRPLGFRLIGGKSILIRWQSRGKRLTEQTTLVMSASRTEFGGNLVVIPAQITCLGSISAGAGPVGAAICKVF